MRIHTAFLVLALAAVSRPAHGGGEDPDWLVEAAAGIDRGLEAFYAAEFEQAIEHLVPAMKALTAGFDEHPVDRALLERGAVCLILALHAREMDDAARDVALGLAEMAPPPWGPDLDLAPDARTYLDDLAGTMPPARHGTLEIAVPDEGCAVDVDGDPVIAGSPVTVQLTTGVHWVGASCPGGEEQHVRVEIEPEQEAQVSLPVPGESAPAPGVEPAPVKKDPLLLHTDVHPVPWYGDGWNLALQGAGVILLGVGAGLLGGSMRVEERAYGTHSLRYADLESKAFDMEVSGWVLMGSGAIALAVGAIRMALEGGEE